MIYVVTGHHTGEMPDGFFTALRMDAVHLPLLKSKVIEQLQIAFAEKPEEFK